MLANISFFFQAVSTMAVSFYVSINLTQNQYHDVQLELLQNFLCQGQGNWEWYKWSELTVPVNMAGIEKKWLKSLHIMSNIKVFAMQGG